MSGNEAPEMATDPTQPGHDSPARVAPAPDAPAPEPVEPAGGPVVVSIDALRSWFEERRSTICACGHPYEAHEHYRRGSDCAFCDCEHWHHP